MEAPKRDFFGAAARSGIHGADSGALSWVARSQKEMETAINKSYQKRAPKNTKIDAERDQTRDNIDAKTHPKTMPKYVSKEIMEITNKHVFFLSFLWGVKTCKLIVNTLAF